MNTKDFLYNQVMLIDDSEMDNLVTRFILEEKKVAREILVFPNAAAALDHLYSLSARNNAPELILLDINMPMMNGFQFLEAFDKLQESIKKKARIIMLSSSKNAGDIERSLNNKYVYDFISKPLSDKDLSRLPPVKTGT